MFIWGDHVLCTGILSAFVKLGIECMVQKFLSLLYFLARLIPRWDRTNVSTEPAEMRYCERETERVGSY